jgi:D-alanyl-D-alanine carboxypeptidase
MPTPAMERLSWGQVPSRRWVWVRWVALCVALAGLSGLSGGCADDLSDDPQRADQDTSAQDTSAQDTSARDTSAQTASDTDTATGTDAGTGPDATSPDADTFIGDDADALTGDDADTFIGDDADALTGDDADTFSDTLADAPDDIDAGPPPEPLPALTDLTDPALTQLQQSVRAALSQPSVSGRQLSALIIDEATGQVLYEENPDLTLRPASNTKLFTTAAALALLGPDHRFETRVVAAAAPDGAGNVSGDLTLLGDHDFTWSTSFYSSARWPLDQLAGQLYAAGVRRVAGQLRVQGEYVYDGVSIGTYDAAAHRATVATQWRAALTAQGITVVGANTTSPSFDPPLGATVELGRWRSLPLAVGCSPINRVSHNEFADALTRHMGWRLEGDSSYAAGERQVLSWMAAEGMDTAGVIFHDGSGLSYDNRVSARHVVALLAYLRQQPEGTAWGRTFSVAGIRGTLSGRMTGPDTIGRVFGKTGTLNVAISTSGFLVHKHDGRAYLFSLLMNDQPDQAAARAAQNQAVEAIARDLRAASGRPASPTLEGVYQVGDGASVEVAWQAVPGAAGYIVWLSGDGDVWNREDARFTTQGLRLRVGGWAPGDKVFVRLTATNAAGESDPSDTYAAQVAPNPSRVLVIDGNDRWQRQPVSENTLGGSHPYAARYVAALPDDRVLGCDTVSDEAVSAGTVRLSDYDAVLWSTAEDAITDFSLDTTQQGLIQAYLEGGGALLLSGAELAWDLGSQRDAAQAAFLSGWLHATYASDDAGTFAFQAAPAGAFAGLPPMSFDTPDDIVVSYPDALAPTSGASTALTYTGGAGGAAAIQYRGAHSLIMLGFPFESVNSAPDRALLLDAALRFFAL